MNRSSLKSLWWMAAIALFLVSGIVYWIFAMPTVGPHSGDGRFQNRSWRFPFGNFGIPVPGYTIDFDQFDLGQPFEATYRVASLPSLPNELGVYLSIPDSAKTFWSDESRQPLTATLEITVLDQDGHVVCEANQGINKMVWAFPEGGPDTFGLYDLDHSFFVPRPGNRYEIRVKYRPATALSDMKGFIHIRCGGSI